MKNLPFTAYYCPRSMHKSTSFSKVVLKQYSVIVTLPVWIIFQQIYIITLFLYQLTVLHVILTFDGTTVLGYCRVYRWNIHSYLSDCGCIFSQLHAVFSSLQVSNSSQSTLQSSTSSINSSSQYSNQHYHGGIGGGGGMLSASPPSKGYVVSGRWDPKDPVFGALNQETPKDGRVLMSVAVDLVMSECEGQHLFLSHSLLWKRVV